MDRRVYWSLSAALGIVIGAITYLYLTPDFSLALTDAILAGSGVGLTVRNHLALSERFGDTYSNSRNWWNVGLSSLIIVAGVFGISPSLPIPTDLGFALVILLTGSILVAWNLGVAGTLWLDAEEREGEAE